MRLRTGKAGENTLDRSVWKRISAAGCKGEAVTMSADPVTLKVSAIGELAVYSAVNALSAEKILPESFRPVILLPPGTEEEELRRIPEFDEDVIGYRMVYETVWRPGTGEEEWWELFHHAPWSETREYERKNKRLKEKQIEVPGYHDINPGTEFADLLDYSKLSFDRMDLERVLRCLKAWPDAGKHLSRETMKKLAAA